MPSRQMAFQFTRPQLEREVEWFRALRREDIERIRCDGGKELYRFDAMVVLAHMMRENGVQVEQIHQLICWRDEKGNPATVQIYGRGAREIN